MKTSMILAAASAAALFAFLPLASVARAQDYTPPGAAPPVEGAPAATHAGDWTLKERERWLDDRINKARDEHDLDGGEADRAHHELDRLRDDENHMRDRHDGQLTDNETTTLEARLDDMAAKIHWVHENAFQKPW